MINGDFRLVFLFTVISWGIYRLFLYKKNGTANWLREVTLFVFLIYFLVMLTLTIFKSNSISFNNPFDAYKYNRQGIFGMINIIPFKETLVTLTDGHTPIKYPLMNIVGNILVFMPLGFLVPLLFDKYNNISKVFTLGLVSTISIELAQLFVGPNISDIDDIIFNTIGSVLGLLCFRLFEKITININVKKVLNSIKDYGSENIFKRSVRVILTIAVLTGTVYIYSVYDQTASDKLSDEKLAKALFTYDIGEIIDVIDFHDEKLYLVKNDNGLTVEKLKRYSSSRYMNSYEGSSYFISENDGFIIDVIQKFSEDTETEKATVMILGKSSDASSVLINLNGNEHKDDINDGGYFLALYPDFIEMEYEDIVKLSQNGLSDVLDVKFFNEDNNEVKNIELAKE